MSWKDSLLSGITKTGNWTMAGNTTARSAVAGAFAGGTYGAFSDNTSFLGGAIGGATLGVGARYAARGGMSMYGALKGGQGLGALSGAGRGMARVFRKDFGEARLATNNGYNKIKGLFV